MFFFGTFFTMKSFTSHNSIFLTTEHQWSPSMFLSKKIRWKMIRSNLIRWKIIAPFPYPIWTLMLQRGDKIINIKHLDAFYERTNEDKEKVISEIEKRSTNDKFGTKKNWQNCSSVIISKGKLLNNISLGSYSFRFQHYLKDKNLSFGNKNK